MHAAAPQPGLANAATACAIVARAPPAPLEPFAPAEIRALVQDCANELEACERGLAKLARIEGALDLAVGEGLAAMCVGDRLISRGFACLRDYAREVLDVRERTAQAMAHLARELHSRPLLRRAVESGEVRLRNAQTVLPVAVGDSEAEWVERARTETVRALEDSVRAERTGGQEDDEWTRFRVRLGPGDRAAVDEALAIAGKLLPGSSRPQRLEAMAQEYLGEHPLDPEDDPGTTGAGAFRREDDRLERRKAALEAETDRWSFLQPVSGVAAPVEGARRFDELTSAREIDEALRELAARRRKVDTLLGYCAYTVRRSGLWRITGFASFEHYCSERLGLSARAVEQRAALEKRLWQVPALRAARDGGLAYEKLRLLARLPDREIAEWVPRARKRTCVALKAEVEEHEEVQMRAARVLRARVPARVGLLLRAAFEAVRRAEGALLDAASCLVRMARHFADTWRRAVKKARTLSQKVRERDLGRCQVPGCSRRAVHAHHVERRSAGGADLEENLVGLCACHHLRGVHGGYVHVWGTAPDWLVWVVAGEPWTDCDFGRRPAPEAWAA